MSVARAELAELAGREYAYGFTTDLDTDFAPKKKAALSSIDEVDPSYGRCSTRAPGAAVPRAERRGASCSSRRGRSRPE